jgi:hypothetical protein
MTSFTVTRTGEPPAGWRELARELGTFYHDPRWIDGVARCFAYRLHYLACASPGRLEAGLAVAEVPSLAGGRRLVSYPFSFIAGPIGHSAEAVTTMMAAARELAVERRARRLEIKSVTAPVVEGFERSLRYTTYRISPEGGEAAVWARLDRPSVQQRVRKGERAGVDVVMGKSEADWLVMARLEERVQQGHGVPAPPRRFFTDLLRGLQRDSIVDLYLARIPDGRFAAGFVMYKGPREWIYAFSASVPDLVREYRATHVLLWAGLKRAVADGVILDLGRTAPEQASLAEFKLRWGAQKVSLAYDYSPSAGGLTHARRDTGALVLVAKVWSHLPAGVARLGSVLYRYLG